MATFLWRKHPELGFVIQVTHDAPSAYQGPLELESLTSEQSVYLGPSLDVENLKSQAISCLLAEEMKRLPQGKTRLRPCERRDVAALKQIAARQMALAMKAWVEAEPCDPLFDPKELTYDR